MHTVPGFLTPAEVATLRVRLAAADFVDGRETATGPARDRKRNQQLAVGSAEALALDAVVQPAFARNDFVRAVVAPVRIVPMRFARYEPGMAYGWHVDGPVMGGPGGMPLRSDMACTIFLNDPESYDGGELSLRSPLGQVSLKLAAGDAVIYPASYVHQVEPVTRGVRLVAVTWIQCAVASAEQRQLLFELLDAVRTLHAKLPGTPELDVLSGVHHNLTRMWGQL